MTRLARVFALLVVLVITSTGQAWAAHRSGHAEPQGPAKVSFGAGFPHLVDFEWGFALGGFGGVSPRHPIGHLPVIFVHGNNVDACDWYPVRDLFEEAGWNAQEMYALSHNGLGGNNGNGLLYDNAECRAEHAEMGWDGTTRITGNDVNVADLYRFILTVREYTGLEKFSIVSHSMGVTLARKTLKVHPELREDLAAFVGIAGANHGTSFCPPGSESSVMSCDEIAQGTPWLEDLNGEEGVDETYPPARWLTVYDGSGAGDPAYAGPTYAQSPRLEGAENREYAAAYHNDLRLSPAIVAEYRAFLELAEVEVLRDLPGDLRAPEGGRGLAASGSGGRGSALVLLAAGLALAVLARAIFREARMD